MEIWGWARRTEMGERGTGRPVQGYVVLVQDCGHYLGSSEKPFKVIQLQMV